MGNAVVVDGEWRRATARDAEVLARLVGDGVRPAQVVEFLATWRVELSDGAAVAVLPPGRGLRRGYGAWWVRDGGGEVAARLLELARSVAGLQVLQISLPEEESLDDPRFVRAYPVWTMTHDGTTWPEAQLPEPLRYGELADVSRDEFSRAYASAYRDQRLVEPAESWDGPADRSVLALAPDGSVAGFVLATGDRSVDLGPIGTTVAWRGRGVGSALLSSMLARCRGREVHLTVDGESPTHAQELYLRYGFRVTERLVAYQVRIS